MNAGRKIIGVSISILVVCFLLLLWRWEDESTGRQAGGVLFYCAAGIKHPVEEVAKEYERIYNVPIQIQYGGSGTLLSNLTVSRTGDLYLAADRSYIEIARKKNLVEESIPLARLRPVIGVARGNPKNIQSIADLLRSDVRVVLANPDAASIGKQTRQLLEQSGLWKKIEKAALAFKPTVTEIANDIKLGTADAGIIWDATANQYEEIDYLVVPPLDSAVNEVVVSVLKSCQNPTAALRFCRYLGAGDKGLVAFKKWGFEPVQGDVWSEKPELTFYSGGVNRLAIQNTIREFQDREGVTVNTVYNGCGILVAQMKTGARPDAFFSCDVTFMTQVADMFAGIEEISQTDMVIALPRGNPRKIRSLYELTAPGLSIGMANPKQSALGALTKSLLEELAIFEEVMKNVRSQTPTADLLVNQLRTGSLDAVIVYEANISKVRNTLEVIPIDHEAAVATQPIGIALETEYPQLMSRLLRAIRSAQSRQRFEDAGFRWLVKSE